MGVPPGAQLGVCVAGGGGRVSGKKSSKVIRRDLLGCKQRDGEEVLGSPSRLWAPLEPLGLIHGSLCFAYFFLFLTDFEIYFLLDKGSYEDIF